MTPNQQTWVEQLICPNGRMTKRYIRFLRIFDDLASIEGPHSYNWHFLLYLWYEKRQHRLSITTHTSYRIVGFHSQKLIYWAVGDSQVVRMKRDQITNYCR